MDPLQPQNPSGSPKPWSGKPRLFARTAPEPPDEKVTLNLSPVQAGLIDLLRAHGYHGTRSSIIRTALQRYFDFHEQRITRILEVEALQLGYLFVDRATLDRARDEEKRITIRLVGTLRFADDVDADLAEDTLAGITVYGAIRGPADVIDLVRGRARL